MNILMGRRDKKLLDRVCPHVRMNDAHIGTQRAGASAGEARGAARGGGTGRRRAGEGVEAGATAGGAGGGGEEPDRGDRF